MSVFPASLYVGELCAADSDVFHVQVYAVEMVFYPDYLWYHYSDLTGLLANDVAIVTDLPRWRKLNL